MTHFSKFASDTSAELAARLRDLTEDKDVVFFGAINKKVVMYIALPILVEPGLVRPTKLRV